MARIEFAKKNFAIVEVEKGANLMKSLLDRDVPVASSCHGDGICAKCRLQIISGAENLSAPSDLEEELRISKKLKAGERISCQTNVLGDVIIDATYW